MKKIISLFLAFLLVIGSFSSNAYAYTTNYNPTGCIDNVSATAGNVKVSGWAFDKDSSATSINVKVYIGSTCLGTLTANQTRDDVNKAYGITGTHGFSGTLSTTLTGTQTVTIKAVNAESSVEYTIGTKSVTIPSSSSSSYTTNYNPNGSVDSVVASEGKVTVGGWAFDKDSSSTSIDVKVYIGSTCLGTLNANQTRDDVNKAYGITGTHGFSGTLSTTLTGTQTVTIKAVNVGSGVEYTIGSKSVTIPSSSTSTDTITYTTNYNPTGCVDSVTASLGNVTVGGWAFDKDSSSTSIDVKVYIGSTCLGTLTADSTRDDVNKAYGITGKHGYSGTLSTTLTGTQTVTIKAVNLQSGIEYTIGSKSVTIPSSTSTYTTKYNPTGCVDSASATTGSVKVSGWAFDKDSSSTSIDVKVYIGSTCLGTLSANQTRDDVNKAYGITGTHGYSGTLSTTLTGTQTVTIKAVNVGSGVEYTIGTKSVTIPSSSTSTQTTTYTTNYNPNGCVDTASATTGSVKVSGWAFDKDSSSTSINVKVYIGTTCLGTLTANQTRDDVNKAYGITGTHGYSGTLSTTLTGTQTIAVKAVNVGSGVEYTIGTKSVTIPDASDTVTSVTYSTKYAPVGCADSISSSFAGIVYAGGWAYDQDSLDTNTEIRMYVGSTLVGTTKTSFTRADVNKTYSITGTHGYDLVCSSPVTGTQTVTIKAVDLTTNKEYTIATKTIAIQNEKFSYILASTLSSTYQTMIDNWIDNHISNTMTTTQKVQAVINYVINMPYNYNYDSCEKMLAHGQGECWGSTDVVLHILERLGIPVGIRTRGNTLAYPDYHIENYVLIDGVTYDLNCGKNTTVPRTYVFKAITTPYSYTKKSDGTIKITDYDGYCTNMVVPSTIDGYTVSEIAANAYANHYEMVICTIPNNITVDTYAFKQCTSLKTVNIYSNTTIQSNAFYCEATTVLGDDVLWIPQGITSKTINTIG